MFRLRYVISARCLASMWVGRAGYGTGLGGGHMPQAESDQILRNAVFQLRQTQGSLGNGSNAAAHHRDAHTSINEAIQQLEVMR